MTDWLKFYIGGLIADISAHKAMIEAQQAEIDRLKAEVEEHRKRENSRIAHPDGSSAIMDALKDELLVPEGWQLVPKEPTKEMLNAPLRESDGCDAQYLDDDAFYSAWEDMLRAAPTWRAQ